MVSKTAQIKALKAELTTVRMELRKIEREAGPLRARLGRLDEDRYELVKRRERAQAEIARVEND